MLVAYEVVFSPGLQFINSYSTEPVREKTITARPVTTRLDKFIFYYAHAGFSNQIYGEMRSFSKLLHIMVVVCSNHPDFYCEH